MEGLRDCLLEGELRRCTLVLHNTGAAPLRAIRVVTCGPSVYVAPDNADMTADGAELSTPSVVSVLAGEYPHKPTQQDIMI